MEAEVWQDDDFGSQTFASIGIREHPAKKVTVRAQLGAGCAPGCAKKVLGPTRCRMIQQALVRDWGLSIRSSCKLAGISRSHLKRPSLIEADALLAEIQRLATKHPRFGYRRIHALLKGLGWQVNVKRIRRIWREEVLQVKKKRRRRRKGSGVTVFVPEQAKVPNQCMNIGFRSGPAQQRPEHSVTDCAG